jgi:hypothetical protein
MVPPTVCSHWSLNAYWVTPLVCSYWSLNAYWVTPSTPSFILLKKLHHIFLATARTGGKAPLTLVLCSNNPKATNWIPQSLFNCCQQSTDTATCLSKARAAISRHLQQLLKALSLASMCESLLWQAQSRDVPLCSKVKEKKSKINHSCLHTTKV